MTDYELLAAMMAGLGAFLFVFVIIAIAVYVLYGMSHMKALKLMTLLLLLQKNVRQKTDAAGF